MRGYLIYTRGGRESTMEGESAVKLEEKREGRGRRKMQKGRESLPRGTFARSTWISVCVSQLVAGPICN